MATVSSTATRVRDRARLTTAPTSGMEAASAAPLPVRRIILQAMAMWLVTRALLVVFTLFVAPGVPLVHATVPPVADPLVRMAAAHPLPGNWFVRDAQWYVTIAVFGYDSSVSPLGPTSFFPLFPLQIHLLTLIVGAQNAALAAMALTNAATLAAFIGLGLLAAHEETSESAPWRLITLVAAFPFAYFLFAPFSEGFFLACVVFAFFCARRGLWWWAAACGVCAALTRPTGVALLLPLAWEYGRQQGWWRLDNWRGGRWRELARPRALLTGVAVVGAVPAGVGCFLLYCGLRFGDPLIYLRSQAVYHAHVSWPVWRTLGEFSYRLLHPTASNLFRLYLFADAGTLLIFLAITLVSIRKLPFLYTLYMLSTLYLLLSTPVPNHIELVPAAGRYMLMAVPVFLVLTRWTEKRPWLELLLVGGGFLLQAVFAILYLNGYWIE